MATSNSSINLVPLDFDSMKDSLKTYLRSQSQFLDYDFEGSNMGVLLDLLSYNTFHNAFYLNMVASESYLDSAQLRNSVVSHAKELNYTPRSARSAKATIDLDFTAANSTVTIPKGTSFTALVGFGLYTFITAEESVHFSANSTFAIRNLEVYEGQLTTDTYIVNYENTTQRFLISDPAIDTRSLEITVVEDNSGTVTTFNPRSTTLDLDEDSAVYFLQAAEDGKYEIIFGDNILGRRPKDGSIVTVSYRVCNAEEGNGASTFTLDDEFTAFTSSPVVTTVDVARGGAGPESIESIKFYAPRYFQTQERAINTSDYEIILRQRFPEINAISAYGGEEVDPPQYGKVFISVDISDVDGLPTSKVNEYFQFLKPRSPLSIDPTFVEPEYLFYQVDSTIKYSVNSTDLNAEQVRSMVVNRIINYNDSELDDFKSSFKYSKFVAEIDAIEGAGIISNDTEVTVYKKVTPEIGENIDLTVSFDIALTKKGSTLGSSYDSTDLVAVRSSDFTLNSERVHIADNGDGTLRIVKSVGGAEVVVVSNIGSVDYDTGSLRIVNFRVDAILDGASAIRLYGVPASRDFETQKNVILTLEPSQINVTVSPIRDGTVQSRQRA